MTLLLSGIAIVLFSILSMIVGVYHIFILRVLHNVLSSSFTGFLFGVWWLVVFVVMFALATFLGFIGMFFIKASLVK